MVRARIHEIVAYAIRVEREDSRRLRDEDLLCCESLWASLKAQRGMKHKRMQPVFPASVGGSCLV